MFYVHSILYILCRAKMWRAAFGLPPEAQSDEKCTYDKLEDQCHRQVRVRHCVNVIFVYVI